MTESRIKHWAARVPLALALVAPGAWGQSAAERIDALERTVSQLQATQAAQASQAADLLPLHGFADVGAGGRNGAAPGTARRGFNAGTMDLYLVPQIGGNVRGLLELVFEFDSEGGLATDLERIQIGYGFSDALTVWLGRFHTPYGYWNTAFHHGAQIQTALTRPRFLEFEDKGGVMPAHAVGVWGNGRMRTGLGRLGWDAYAFNGNRISGRVLDFQASGDNDGHIGLGFAVGQAMGNSGLTLGLHAYRMSVAGDTLAPMNVTSTMSGGYLVYDSGAWEVLAEGYRFGNLDRTSGNRWNSNAWYLQAGFEVGMQVTVYGRAERAAYEAQDPYFAGQDSGTSYRRAVLGARYAVSEKAALKLEAARTREDGLTGTASSLAVQYSIRF